MLFDLFEVIIDIALVYYSCVLSSSFAFSYSVRMVSSCSSKYSLRNLSNVWVIMAPHFYFIGIAGFEPTHRGVKVPSLTAWLYPKNVVWHKVESNHRHTGLQPAALPSWAIAPKSSNNNIILNLLWAINSTKPDAPADRCKLSLVHHSWLDWMTIGPFINLWRDLHPQACHCLRRLFIQFFTGFGEHGNSLDSS